MLNQYVQEENHNYLQMTFAAAQWPDAAAAGMDLLDLGRLTLASVRSDPLHAVLTPFRSTRAEGGDSRLFTAKSGLPWRGVRRKSVVIGKAVGPHACVGPTAFVNASASRLHPSPSEGRKQQPRIGPIATMDIYAGGALPSPSEGHRQ